MNTKEKILVAALRLFAVNGYEAVSVSQIAGELGITKGALYKHYKNKRDIFNCIFEYVCRLDVERSRKSGVPEQDYSDMPEAFSHVSAKSLGNYMKEQFRYWSEDEIACNFRKMLTLEQYKSPEMSALYQKVLVSGPLEYIENLLCEMSKETGETAALSPCIGNRVLFSLLSCCSVCQMGQIVKKQKKKSPKGICVISMIFFQKYFSHKTERRKEIRMKQFHST